jgi:serine protease Do
MDDKDKFITVNHNNPEDGNNPENTDVNKPEETPDFSQQENNIQHERKYDEFMYQPIGFEEYEKQKAEETEKKKRKKEKRRRSRNEVIIIVLLLLVVIIVIGISAFALIRDVIRSDTVFDDYQISENVVLYSSSKPEDALSDANYIDENGKYTTEGIAAAVRPSIVEIYTYSDSSRSTPVGSGSGIIISDDGYIVTNAHVLQSDGYHTVTTSDNEIYDAKIIGRDTKTDIAIIKISASGLQAAVLGDSDEVVVGEQVMAIGNPAGLSGSVTDGIVSAVNRQIKSDSTGFEMNCIQTNADISPGNSGGALVNMYGQVIGITSSKYVSSSYEGLGFAITINEAKPIMEELINQGYVSGRFRIGIQLIDMDGDSKKEAIEEELGFELPEDFTGIYIADISEDCDIANTALEVGDFITAINGKSIKTYDELYDTISSMYGAGDKVPATCAHVTADGDVSYYEIEFMLMEDTSGNY